MAKPLSLWERIEARFADLQAQITGKAPAAGTAAAGTATTTAAPTAGAVDHTKIISDFRSELNTFKAELDAKDGEITKLKAQAETDQAAIKAKDEEIVTLKGTAKTAGEVATDLVASQGLPADQLPAAGKPAGGAAATVSLRQQYNKLLAEGKSKEAGEFYAANSDKPEFWKS